MSKLSDTQAIILSAASQRADGNLLPLPNSLRGGAAAKVIAALLSRGFACEQPSQSFAKADARLNSLWSNEPNGRGVLLLIADSGRAVLGLEPAGAPVETVGGEDSAPAKKSRPRPLRASGAPTTTHPRQPRETKQAALVALLGRAEGVTVAEAAAALGWQPHTVRGAFAGALKTRLGLTVTSERVEGKERVYRLG
jgi:Protein of unknown function (DUF3489)